jgi:hypothetical protein
MPFGESATIAGDALALLLLIRSSVSLERRTSMETKDRPVCIVEDLDMPGAGRELEMAAAGTCTTCCCCCATAQCD